MLRDLLGDETSLSYRRWAYVRDASGWARLKEVMIDRGTNAMVGIAVRERGGGVGGKGKGGVGGGGGEGGIRCGGWESVGIKLRNWREGYDEVKGKFYWEREAGVGKRKAERMWDAPLKVDPDKYAQIPSPSTSAR
jgi:hypothetical protein